MEGEDVGPQEPSRDSVFSLMRKGAPGAPEGTEVPLLWFWLMASLWTRGGISWRRFLVQLYDQVWEEDVLGRCSELAYVFLFSVFPLLLFLTTLLGYLAGSSVGLRAMLFEYLARVSPSREVAALLQTTLAEITAARG